MQINCDLGEGLGIWSLGQDSEIMPYIHMANIACGFHASDPLTMQKTVSLAVKNKVSIGAHPGYPDLVGFGRRSLAMSTEELIASIHYQVGALEAICQVQGTQVNYIKPHGALYNDMMANEAIFQSVCEAIAYLSTSLTLVVQAVPDTRKLEATAEHYGITLCFEAFADRNYLDNGLLVPRTDKDAVLHDAETIISRSIALKQTGKLLSVNNKPLALKVDTLCVHGDNPKAVLLTKNLFKALNV